MHELQYGCRDCSVAVQRGGIVEGCTQPEVEIRAARAVAVADTTRVYELCVRAALTQTVHHAASLQQNSRHMRDASSALQIMSPAHCIPAARVQSSQMRLYQYRLRFANVSH